MMSAPVKDQVVDERRLPVIMVDPKIFSLGLTPTEFTVYVTLLSFAGNATNQCWPSKEKIASRAGVSKRTVDTTIKDLVTKKLIEVKDGEKTRSNIYVIKDVMKRGRVQNLQGQGAKSAPTEGAKSAPELESVRTSINEQKEPPAPTPPNQEGVDHHEKTAPERGGDDGKVIPMQKRDVVFDALAVSLFKVDLNDKAQVKGHSGRVVALKKKLKGMYPNTPDDRMAAKIVEFPAWYHAQPETKNAALPLGENTFPGYFSNYIKSLIRKSEQPRKIPLKSCPDCAGDGVVIDRATNTGKPCHCLHYPEKDGAK